MIYTSWLVLSLPFLVSASWMDSGARMLKHRKLLSRANSGINDTGTDAITYTNTDTHIDTSIVRRAKTYKIVDQYAGSKFFDGWDFFNEHDPTNGNVNYLAKADAIAKNLAFVEPDGTVVMKVDDTNVVSAGANRDSVRIASTKSYTGGLFVLDVQTMPHGCGVWPAFWSVGPQWPNGGEIDILEGVHDVSLTLPPT
ncbi:hypothetical protein FRC07_000359 [Ceratobasidium sp. 392]|nr:hypothetical protein FRC07_000359 [Ceratobasidium sp. 392]